VVSLVVACAFAMLAGGASGATQQLRSNVYTGYGFDTCHAPSLTALAAWSASPYRAVGVYIGGVNRACGDGNLSAGWVAAAVGQGWSVMPLYVGLQAPCVSQSGLARLSGNTTTAGTQGVAAADDAASRAVAFGLPSGSPIYFDMEGYSTKDAACSRAVQSFVTGWVTELRASGWVAGVYGSAASTIRDVANLGVATPDDAWIADWNGVASVFGDGYVSDSLWPDHQRIHQYKGGHRETWGGVTIDVDSDFVDGAVVGGTAPPPPPPPPPAGSVGSGDGNATASWPSGAFTQPVAVTLTPVAPAPAPATYAVRLAVTQADGVTPVTTFAQPLTVTFLTPGTGVVPAFSGDGTTWTPLPAAVDGALPAGADAAYSVEPGGAFDVLTLVPGLFGLVPDTKPPTQPSALAGRFAKGALTLTWQPARDDSGIVASYRVLLDGAPLESVAGNVRRAVVRSFHPNGQTVYRVQAVDAAGNAGKPSRPLVVMPSVRPTGLPRALPRWAWALFTWQHGGGGARPATAPRRPPAWYWRWSAWRLRPFHLQSV
jgi:hypothetical protein